MRSFKTHGSGLYKPEDFRSIGRNVVIEPEVMVFHPENIIIGDNVYIGHRAILKGYHKNLMKIGSDTWVGQMAFLHSAGNLVIGQGVGIGPGVKILTSEHTDPGIDLPVMEGPLKFSEVSIGDGTDLGVGSVVLAGVRIGKGVMVGAGSVVTSDVKDHAVVAGVPAKFLRWRSGMENPDGQG